jgi:hypothetical protein
VCILSKDGCDYQGDVKAVEGCNLFLGVGKCAIVFESEDQKGGQFLENVVIDAEGGILRNRRSIKGPFWERGIR